MAANLGEGLRIENVSVTPIQSFPYIAPYRMKFLQVTVVVVVVCLE